MKYATTWMKLEDVMLLNQSQKDKYCMISVISETWTVKKAERQRTDAFELWC